MTENGETLVFGKHAMAWEGEEHGRRSWTLTTADGCLFRFTGCADGGKPVLEGYGPGGGLFLRGALDGSFKVEEVLDKHSRG